MTQTATNTGAGIRPVARTSRFRPWIALAAATVLFGCGLLDVLPFIVVLPVIGVVIALGAPPTMSPMPDPLPGGRVTPSSGRSWSPHWPWRSCSRS